MKNTIIILFISLFYCCSNFTSNQNQNTYQFINVLDRADTLKSLYNKINEESITLQEKYNYEEAFFNFFPDNFQVFDSLYGFDIIMGGRILDEYASHIQYFFKIQQIDKDKYISKIVNISIGGLWQADGIGIFQYHMNEKVKRNLGLAVKILKEKTDKQVFSFWYFFFDGPHPELTEETLFPESVQIKVKNMDERIYQLMQEALIKVKKDNLH